MRVADFQSWYEASLPAGERKMRGHFSTPPQLVERILDRCGYRPESDLSSLRVLDPACGSGNFLVAAVRRLSASAHRRGFTASSLITSVQRNVWGFDPDPIACFLAEMRVRAALPEELSGRVSAQIHQGDGLAVPWEHCENVDVFVANPPYLASKNTDLRGYRSARERGQTDSYLLFLDLALQAVRPGGWIGLVLPDPVLARRNATRERQRLLAETTVHHLWHLSGVFTAHVGAVVLIAQKRPPTRLHHIAWVRQRWQHSQETESFCQPRQRVAQSLLLQQTGAELRYLLSEPRYALLARLHAASQNPREPAERGAFAPLGKSYEIWRGEELSKESAQLLSTSPRAELEGYPVLRGGVDVQPYARPQAQRWIARQDIVKPLERYRRPKLLVVKSTGRLQATLDLDGHVVLQTLYFLSLRIPASEAAASGESGALAGGSEEDELYFLLALLNSRLLREYVTVLHTAYKWVQPQIEQSVLAQLPLPRRGFDAGAKAQIVARAKRLMHACEDVAGSVELEEREIYREVYEEQEQAISALYASALQVEQPRMVLR